MPPRPPSDLGQGQSSGDLSEDPGDSSMEINHSTPDTGNQIDLGADSEMKTGEGFENKRYEDRGEPAGEREQASDQHGGQHGDQMGHNYG